MFVYNRCVCNNSDPTAINEPCWTEHPSVFGDESTGVSSAAVEIAQAFSDTAQMESIIQLHNVTGKKIKNLNPHTLKPLDFPKTPILASGSYCKNDTYCIDADLERHFDGTYNCYNNSAVSLSSVCYVLNNKSPKYNINTSNTNINMYENFTNGTIICHNTSEDAKPYAIGANFSEALIYEENRILSLLQTALDEDYEVAMANRVWFLNTSDGTNLTNDTVTLQNASLIPSAIMIPPYCFEYIVEEMYSRTSNNEIIEMYTVNLHQSYECSWYCWKDFVGKCENTPTYLYKFLINSPQNPDIRKNLLLSESR